MQGQRVGLEQQPRIAGTQTEQLVVAPLCTGRVLTMPYRTDMPQVLAACDIVVDASWAGTGITGTIREAMAIGRAVVATDCGGNRELVGEKEKGVCVKEEWLLDSVKEQGALPYEDYLL